MIYICVSAFQSKHQNHCKENWWIYGLWKSWWLEKQINDFSRLVFKFEFLITTRTILYDPYYMDHIIWTLILSLYNMVVIDMVK